MTHLKGWSRAARFITFAAFVGAATALDGGTKRASAAAVNPDSTAKPTIVLVHGAFADGTGWQHVIRLLQADGYTVIAAQNALNSLAEDVAATKRLVDAQKGRVVLVGHSYGGAVITGAAAGNPNVVALVYVAAFAPDAGEPIGAHTEKYPSALATSLVIDAAGYGTIDRAKFRDVFAQDVSAVEARIMAATQKPANATTFAASLPAAAWRTTPSWYVVSKRDRTINPELERFYAKRMGAQTIEVDASHVSFYSRPKEVVRVIKEASSAPARSATR